MDAYVRAMRPGAALMMSGILEHDIPAITEKAGSVGLETIGTRTRDGWASVLCRK